VQKKNYEKILKIDEFMAILKIVVVRPMPILYIIFVILPKSK